MSAKPELLIRHSHWFDLTRFLCGYFSLFRRNCSCRLGALLQQCSELLSIDPELMIQMLIVGDAMGIRSERRLCEEVHLNLAYRWFCRLDLTDPVPDHSTFSKNRHGRFRESNLFRHLFESVLARCITEGRVGGETFGADASLIRADASGYSKIAFSEWTMPEDATRATQEYLDMLDDAAFGAATEVKPKTLSPSDPAARLTGANGDRPFYAYSTNYLVDPRLARCGTC